MSEIKINWDLEKYFYKGLSDENYINDKNNVLKLVTDFVNKYKNNLKTFEKAEQIKLFYNDYEILEIVITKPYQYLFYLNSLDTQDQNVLKQLGEFQAMWVEVSNLLLFIDQEFKEIWYEKLILLSNEQLLKPYKHAIYTKAMDLKYILDEKSENILNQKSLPIWQIWDLYDEFYNSFMFEIEIDWEKKLLTDMEIRALRANPVEEIRKNAIKSMRNIYNTKQSQIVFWNLYSGVVKNWITNIKIRWFNWVMEPRNISEDMETDVVNMLMEVVHDSYSLFQRYIKVKKKLLWKDVFYNWDLMAPISQTDRKISFQDAYKLHLEAMENFDEDFLNYSKEMFEDGRVDVMPNPGKMWGAYASYSKWYKSFVLLNFAWRIEDVSTISHELWHATHGWLSQQQTWSVYSTSLSMAETASIFNELLLADYLKKNLTNEEKIDFLNKQLEDVFATIFRQVQYVSFEKIIHERTMNGEWLTYEDYNQIWRQTQIDMSWNEVVYDVEAKDESGWSMIPHIFRTPFYCYAYAFGNILSFALYGAYKQRWKEFIKDYKEILSAWWSMSPKELLMNYWFDITKKDFYLFGIKEIKKMLEEFESLS